MNNTEQQANAVRLARRGLRLFPLIPKQKRPRAGWSYQNATDDAETVARWFQVGAADIGARLADSGVICLDLDNHKRGQFDNARRFLAKHAPVALNGLTYSETTPAGGLHIFFKAPNGEQVPTKKLTLCDGLEIITNFITVAPSLGYGSSWQDKTGAPYLLDPESLTECPRVVLDWLKSSPPRPNARQARTVGNFSASRGAGKPRKFWAGRLLDELAQGATTGNRHNYLTRVLGLLLSSGANPETVALFYEFAVNQCQPLPDANDAARIWRDINQKHEREL